MPVDTAPVAMRIMRVCDYVDLPLELVAAMLEAPDVDDMLAVALQSAVGADARDVTVRTNAPERLGDGVARIAATWQTIDSTGRESTGVGTLLALVVQSGREAVTELLVTVSVPMDVSPRAAGVARRFLAEVTASLAAAAPGSARP